MHSKKTLLIILGLALLLGCVLVLRFRRERRFTQRTQGAPQTSEGPWFESAVEAALFNSRPPWEIPRVILGTPERGPKLNQNSPGVRIGNITSNRLELSAEFGWDRIVKECLECADFSALWKAATSRRTAKSVTSPAD